MTVFWGELVGTALLVLLGNGVVANVTLRSTKGHASGWIVIAAGWGVAVYVAASCVAPLTGAHLNPAVTVGLLAAGKLDAALVPPYLGGQLVGGFLGAVLVWLSYRKHYEETNDPATLLGTFATGPAIRAPFWNLVCELIGTFVLMFAVLRMAPAALEMAAVAPTAPPKLGLGAVGLLPIALVVFGIGLSLGGPTGYAINPARDLAPRLAHAVLPLRGKGSSDWGYAWIPIVGPLLGAVLAALVSSVLPAAGS